MDDRLPFDQEFGCVFSRRRMEIALRAARFSHFLISSVVCALNGFSIWAYAQTATMTMRNFSDAFLVDYLQSVGPRCTSSVGGYQLENQGIQLFDNIDGDYFAILGLPMIPLLNFLRFVKAIPS